MSVFLRWGIFGILGVAALVYAYNASKRMAAAHARSAPVSTAPVVQVAAPAAQAEMHEARPSISLQPPPAATAECEAELVVAQHAIEMHQQGAPLDRVL